MEEAAKRCLLALAFVEMHSRKYVTQHSWGDLGRYGRHGRYWEVAFSHKVERFIIEYWVIVSQECYHPLNYVENREHIADMCKTWCMRRGSDR